MAYIYYNPNPKHKNSVGDCVIRAVSKALGISWETAYIDLVMQGYNMGDMPSSNAVLNAYLRSKGFRKHAIDELCPDCYSFNDFANEHFKGTYILGTGTHVATCIDGDLFDAWDSSECIPLYYYAREK
jgi:hypothetical protein